MIARFIDRPREDSLTAAVIGHLLHLPIEVAWNLLEEACGSPMWPACGGEPIAVEGWPSWNAAGTRNGSRVVPDLLIRFQTFDLIVEAKRWDKPMQDSEQWKAELVAYVNEYGHHRRHVHMLALGGTHSHRDEKIEVECSPRATDTVGKFTFVCAVHMCQWSSLLLVCCRLKRRIEKQVSLTSIDHARIRVLDDIIRLFAHHRILPISWFDDFSFTPNLLSDSLDDTRNHFLAATQFYRSR